MIDKDRMIDLSAYYGKLECYTDFEGMADPREVLNICRTEDGKYVWEVLWDEPERQEIGRTMLLHYLFQRADTYEISDLTPRDIMNFTELIDVMMESRWYSKVTAEMVTELEQQEPEE